RPFTTRRPPPATLFPYTTLFRSARPTRVAAREHRRLLLRPWIRVHRRVDPPPAATPPRPEMADRDLLRRSGLSDRLAQRLGRPQDRKSTRLNSSHVKISYAVFCL